MTKQVLQNTFLLSISCVLLGVGVGCTAQTGPGSITKEEAAALGGKSDGVDWCDEMAWYGDGYCDPWCPLADQDCSDDECTVGAESTCDEGEFCMPGVCLAYCLVDDPGCCAPATCQASAEPDFCTRATCGPGTICNEETDSCERISCPQVLCALYCPYGFNNGADGCPVCSCSPDPIDFCPTAFCGPGTVCNEETDTCDPDGEPDFCTRALCGPGTVCDEATDSCVAEEPSCVVSGCNGEICANTSLNSICIALPEHACYDDFGVCDVQADGNCGWTQGLGLEECIDSFN